MLIVESYFDRDRSEVNFSQQIQEKVAASNYATYFESEHHRYVNQVTDPKKNVIVTYRVYVMEGPILKARHGNFHDTSEK